jgi:hypothetical protein
MLIGYKNGKKAGYEFQEFQVAQAEFAKRQGKIDEYRSDTVKASSSQAKAAEEEAKRIAAEQAKAAEEEAKPDHAGENPLDDKTVKENKRN